MLINRTCLSLVLICFIVSAAYGQNQDQALSVVTPDKRQRIERLLEATGALNIAKMMSAAVTRQMSNALKQARPDIPARAMDIVAEEVNSVISEEIVAQGGFIDLITPLYARHFTIEDLDALIAFYESPVGIKAVRSMPQVTQEAIEIGQKWGQSLSPKIVDRIRARFIENGYKL